MSAVPAVSETALEAAGAVVSETALILADSNLPWSDYERLGAFIGQMNRSCAWWVGDIIIFGEAVYGESYAQIESVLGLAPQTIANRASVARHIPPERRRASLPFGVHAEVAYLEPKERDHWLDRAEKGQWTRAKLREAMRAAKEIESGRPMGDLAETSKIGESHEEHHSMPAVKGDFLGELVSDGSMHICPNCGYAFS